MFFTEGNGTRYLSLINILLRQVNVPFVLAKRCSKIEIYFMLITLFFQVRQHVRVLGVSSELGIQRVPQLIVSNRWNRIIVAPCAASNFLPVRRVRDSAVSAATTTKFSVPSTATHARRR